MAIVRRFQWLWVQYRYGDVVSANKNLWRYQSRSLVILTVLAARIGFRSCSISLRAIGNWQRPSQYLHVPCKFRYLYKPSAMADVWWPLTIDPLAIPRSLSVRNGQFSRCLVSVGTNAEWSFDYITLHHLTAHFTSLRLPLRDKTANKATTITQTHCIILRLYTESVLRFP